MKTYRSNEKVQAMVVNSQHGSFISSAKQGKNRLCASDKGCVDLGQTWAGQHTVKVGDVILFKNNLPHAVMTAAAFEADYKAVKEKAVDPDPDPAIISSS
jgi:hypothetical protein